ncbi:MAG: MarR family transcriptional regulator, partial [Aggregatilineales bacterium]
IGEKLQIDRTTMVKLVNDLEKHNLIERERDARDRRAYVISLSRDGGSLLPRISQRAVKAEKTSLAQLEQSEIKALFQILLKLL